MDGVSGVVNTFPFMEQNCKKNAIRPYCKWFLNLVLGEVGVEILFKFVLLVIFKKNWDFVFGTTHFPLWSKIVFYFREVRKNETT